MCGLNSLVMVLATPKGIFAPGSLGRIKGRRNADWSAQVKNAWFANGRRILQAGWDMGAWIISMTLAVTFRFDFDPSEQSLSRAALFGLGLALLQIIVGSVLQLYRGRYRVASFDEVSGVALAAVTVGAMGTAVLLVLTPAGLPRSSAIIATGFSLIIMLAGRFMLRTYRRRAHYSSTGEPTLIYGAGEAGEQLVRLIQGDANAPYFPVGFIDDDPRKRLLRLGGVRVLGGDAQLESIAAKTEASTLVVAIAGIDSARLLELDRRCRVLGIALRVIPTSAEIVGGAVKLGDISDVTEEDLLGRKQVQVDEAAIAELIKGKRVLITGAGGSIGSEIARQVHRYRAAFVGMLDRDESALQEVQLSIDGKGLLSSDELLLADIRDADAIAAIFDHIRPDIVFHAAALKHLPLLERFPTEAHKTNVIGTANVLKAALAASVPMLVNISTDKAADPISILGRSKMATERMTAGATPPSEGRYVSVRFGNVLGSRGSVLNTFRRQIKEGGPVTVTHPDVTRYFMTITEAVHLVLQAAAVGAHGETLVLNMGQPVRIADVAAQMVAKSGRNIDIVFTGLRPSEKMTEILTSDHEHPKVGSHPLISHVSVNPLPEAEWRYLSMTDWSMPTGLMTTGRPE